MALRLVEVSLPTEDATRLEKSLAKDGVVAHWSQPISDRQTLVKILLRVEDTEHLLDHLEELFRGTDFRAVLVPVEATLPRLEVDQSGSDTIGDPEVPARQKPSSRISREELYQQVNEGVQLTKTFVVLVALSTVVAAMGIAYDSTTVVIGAMVIAPLLGPNVALSLAAALGDTQLAKSAVRTSFVGILVALVVAILIGFTVNVDPRAGEIQSRLHTQIKDVVLALASGSAGVLSITTVAPAALIGVMVAVALLPPLATFGLLVGSGHIELSLGALLLFATNIICINLAGVVTLLAQNVRPRTWWEADQARKAIRIAIAFWAFLLIALVALIVVLQNRS